jgi:large subunit ribosomal protein L5
MAEEKDKKKKSNEAAKAAGLAKKKAKADAAAAQADDAGGDDVAAQQPAPPPRLIAHYRDTVVPALKQQFGYTNLFEVPKIEKIIISMGLGKAVANKEKGKMEIAEKELATIAGQKPVRCKAKKSVANFKIREGEETGLKVTLRGNRMYEFLDRLITLAFPRVKDFRGVSPDGFDKNGNYNFGFTEQTVFPEVDGATVTFQQGMNITMVTTADKPEEGRELLKQFGFPFRTEEDKKKK